jgi:hypothetical protein
VGGQHIFDLEGRNILCVADDRVFDTAGDTDIAAGIDQPQIAGAQPAFLIERVGVECRVRIAEEALGSLEPQLTFMPDGQFDFSVVDHADADPWYRRAHGVVEHLRRGSKRPLP